MATRDLTLGVIFDVENSDDLATAAENMEKLADATSTVDETSSVELILPQAAEIDAVGTSLSELGVPGGPVDTAKDKVGGLQSSFGQLVGAIGLVNIATAGADFIMDKFADQQERIATVDAFDDAQVLAFADAIRQAGDDVTALVDALEGTQRITGIVEQTGDILDITNDLANAGVTADEYFRVLDGGQESFDAFLSNLQEQGVGEEARNRIQLVGIDNLRNLEEGNLNAAASNEVFAESQQSANDALQALLTQQDPMSQFTEEWDTLRRGMRDGSIDTQTGADALNTLADGLNLTTEEVLKLAQADLDEAAAGALAFADALNSIEFDNTDIEGATSAFSAYTDQLFSAANEAERREAAFDALSASAEDQALTFNIASEAGRAQSDALEAVARVIDEDLAKAYDNANGSQAEFIAAATQIGDETLARLQTELGLTDAELDTLRNTLGLTATDYEARFNLAGAEEARLQLDLLSGAIEGLPTDIEQTVTQQILAGDFVAARDTVANFYAENPVSLPTEVDESGAESDIQSKVIDTAARKVAIIDTSADTAGADSELDLVSLEVRTATIGAEADTAAADSALDAVANADRTARIDVVTGSIDLPTDAQLRNMIGTVRVPVQAFWNTRIEGNRPI